MYLDLVLTNQFSSYKDINLYVKTYHVIGYVRAISDLEYLLASCQ
jgi:hypothetical protein